MSYRDEREAQEARVQELEEDLADARRTIARLQGESATIEAKTGETSRFLGAPTQHHVERELPFEITDGGYEAIAELLRARLSIPGAPPAQVGQVGRTLTFQRLGLLVEVARRADGKTRLRLEQDHRGFPFVLGASVVGSTFAGLLPVIGFLKAFHFSPAGMLLALPLLTIGFYSLLRPLISRRVHRERAQLVDVLESVALLAAQHARPTRARIAEATPERAEEKASEQEAEEAEALERAEVSGRGLRRG